MKCIDRLNVRINCKGICILLWFLHWYANLNQWLVLTESSKLIKQCLSLCVELDVKVQVSFSSTSSFLCRRALSALGSCSLLFSQPAHVSMLSFSFKMQILAVCGGEIKTLSQIWMSLWLSSGDVCLLAKGTITPRSVAPGTDAQKRLWKRICGKIQPVLTLVCVRH